MIKLGKALLITVILIAGLFLSMVLADMFYPSDRKDKREIVKSDFTIYPKSESSHAMIRPKQERKTYE